MKYSKIYSLKPGDRIIEPIFQTALTKHHVIYLGSDEFGTEWVAENYKFSGVQIIPAQQYFSRVNVITRIERFSGTEKARIQAVRKALRLAGKPYNLLAYNCEHFANEIQHGKAESHQVRNFFIAIAALFSIILIFQAFKYNKWKTNMSI